MLMITSMSVYLHAVIVLGPSTTPPAPAIVEAIITHARPDGALLPPALIDQLSLNPSGLTALQSLDYIHYCGAPLSATTAVKITPHVRLAPSIGSTEAGGYFTVIRDNNNEDWEYLSFQRHAGAELEPRHGGLHELVFIRRREFEAMQQIFLVHPDKQRFETSDLWIEHPERKGLWKMMGRMDDYVYLSHGEGLHASTLEPEIERNEIVRAALIGGHGKPKPVVLIELVPDAQAQAQSEAGCEASRESLRENLEAINRLCHPSVRLSADFVVFASREKPFGRTAKGSVARAQTLKSYEMEIEALYETLACANVGGRNSFEGKNGRDLFNLECQKRE